MDEQVWPNKNDVDYQSLKEKRDGGGGGGQAQTHLVEPLT